MCGIVGYIGDRPVTPVLLDGLRHLEYRGYDSAGVAVLRPGDESQLAIYKEVGRVAALAAAVPEDAGRGIGIAHTRWATHGGVTRPNAHPHTDGADRIAVIHNGIIDNAPVLRARLEAEGVVFRSETDSEVLPHLIRKFYAGDPVEAVRLALRQVRGTYGIAVLHADHPDRIVAARNGSPLVIGLGEDETFLASDPHALVRYTRRVIYLDDGELAVLTRDGVETSRLDGHRVDQKVEELEALYGDEGRGAFPTYMAKEIHEQPQSIQRCIQGRVLTEEGNAKLGGFDLAPRDLVRIRQVTLLGCGTSYHAGLIGAAILEAVARVPARAVVASEYRYSSPVVDPDALFLAVSQSGETFDTLAAIREVQLKGGRVLGVVNVVGSTIARTCGAGVYLHTGPEVAVASTKAFTSQVAALMLFTLMLARSRHLSPTEGRRLAQGLQDIPGRVQAALEWLDGPGAGAVDAAVSLLTPARYVLFMGRGPSYPVGLEGALKLKEIAYIPCEAYPAGEMKHGPIAMLDQGSPVVVIVPDDGHRERTLSNVQEVRARGAAVIAIHTEGDAEAASLAQVSLPIPRVDPLLSPLVSVLPMQLLAYRSALALGRDVDRPRNLAKSVTVE
jgi:glutamine---fructose-6-phosphate transaminase (isomerizing)